MPSALRHHWALWAVCALFLLVGALTLDDYSAWVDTQPQRVIGGATLDYLAGDGERAFEQIFSPHDRYFGAAFEAPLVLIERILSLEHERDVYFSRHLLTHLFFLIGGVFCYLLVLRMFNSRVLALIAFVLFLLHPRIYAHSFFNSKDPSTLAAFMIALYLAHRAFRRDTLGSFLLCGVGVGLLVNLRIMGVVLFVAVLALRALDLAFAGSTHERKRALLTGGAFALAALLTYYASLPVLWTDPGGRFAELVQTLRSHPLPIFELFRGEWLLSTDGPPFDYVPVWVGITTPPATLLLALIGAVALAWRALRRPRDILRNGQLRFGLLLAALPVAVVAVAVILESNLYNNWRHLHFLYAPLLLLAAFGLRWLASVPRGRWPRAGACTLAAMAVAVTAVSMIRLHPFQNNYFNFTVDRTTPGQLSSLYVVDYWKRSAMSVLDGIIRDHPSGVLFLSANGPWHLSRIPEPERERFVWTRDFRTGERNFHAIDSGECSTPASLAPIYTARLYATTLRCVVDPVDWFGDYRRAALATEPLVRARFDAHRVGDVLVYLRDGCHTDDMDARFFLRIHPVAPADRTSFGYENRDFAFTERGVRIDGDCVAVAPLPNYPIARIETGQLTPERALAALRAVAGDAPRARSRFDVWLDAGGRGLIYARDECSADDVVARFFLHTYPSDERVLRGRQAEYGFDNLNFDFPKYGVHTRDSGCIATVPLPAYPIATIHTGQFDDTGTLWTARFAVTLPQVELAALAREPLARSVFDVRHHDDALLYVRDGCSDGDASAAFFLHVVPGDPGDLPPQRERYGFDNLDFFLWERGARTDDRCIAVVPLPDYPIATVRTGQYDDTGALWTVEFALPDGE